MANLGRRRFIEIAAITGAGIALGACSPKGTQTAGKSASPASTSVSSSAPQNETPNIENPFNGMVLGHVPGSSGKLTLVNGLNVQTIVEAASNHSGAWSARVVNGTPQIVEVGPNVLTQNFEGSIEFRDSTTPQDLVVFDSLSHFSENKSRNVTVTIVDGTPTGAMFSGHAEIDPQDPSLDYSLRCRMNGKVFGVTKEGTLLEPKYFIPKEIKFVEETLPGQERSYRVDLHFNVDPRGLMGVVFQDPNGSTLFALDNSVELQLGTAIVLN